MQTTDDLESSIIFLGLAEEVHGDPNSFPIHPVNIIQISQFKPHVIFPIPSEGYKCIFLIRNGFINRINEESIEIVIYDPDNRIFGKIQMEFGLREARQTEEKIDKNHTVVISLKDSDWRLISAPMGEVIQKPGVYTFYVNHRNNEFYLGEIQFLYRKPEPYTVEQLRAIESDPYSLKMAAITLGCKHCSSKMEAYCSLERSIEKEDQGHIWYQDFPEIFNCECGATSFGLQYCKEGLPGLLGRDVEAGTWSYERRYSHAKVESVIQEFNKVLTRHTDEAALQKFIEGNPIMLAKFYAKAIFVKPNINGKYFADFAILNASNDLVFIEIERPSLQLFKKSKKEQGHPTADLYHAYEQTRDWQEQYRQFPQSFLDKLSLRLEDIMTTKWVVIAGRKGREKAEHLQRHLTKSIYDTEFLTYDDLASSLREISRGLP
jgi:hypothetical protein